MNHEEIYLDDCCCDFEDDYGMPLIGDPAPEFVANTSNGEINFPEDYAGKWVILFSHPADFTPVCTTEFLTFASMEEEFKAINTELIGLSIDSVHSHIAWLRSIENVEWKDFKNLSVNFPIIDDVGMDVSNKYGMIQGASTTSTIRAVFIIDPEGIIRLIMYYPASTGRNFDEILRCVKALQKTDEMKVATPADWRPGEPVIDPNPGTKAGVQDRIDNADERGVKLADWYLGFKEDK